jgi:hypothetical protein
MKRIVFTNDKVGVGVGKPTPVVNLVVDMDHQADAIFALLGERLRRRRVGSCHRPPKPS